MKIGVLGTGVVGRSIAGELVAVGHEVKMGSRSPDNASAAEWVEATGAGASQGTFAEAAAFGQLVFNCTAGEASLDALRAAGADNLAGKVVVDVSNALDFSQGMPPSLSISSKESVGERIQAEFPDAHVVKTLNTVNNAVMVEPADVPGDHDVFLSGNDEEAKVVVRGILESFGWPPTSIVDLGDITTARGVEHYLPLWLRFFGLVGHGRFNIKLVR